MMIKHFALLRSLHMNAPTPPIANSDGVFSSDSIRIWLRTEEAARRLGIPPLPLLAGPCSSQNMTCIYCSIVIFSPSKHLWARVAELNLSNATIRLTWRTLFRSVRSIFAGACQELSRMARGSLSPAIRLLWFGARGPRRPGTAWIMPANLLDP